MQLSIYNYNFRPLLKIKLFDQNIQKFNFNICPLLIYTQKYLTKKVVVKCTLTKEKNKKKTCL